MCITYLSRDSCRNLIYKNLGSLSLSMSSTFRRRFRRLVFVDFEFVRRRKNNDVERDEKTTASKATKKTVFEKRRKNQVGEIT